MPGADAPAGNARHGEVLRLLDDLDGPVDAETLWKAGRERGLMLPLSSLYRVLARLAAAGLVVELRARGRRRFLSAASALTCTIVNAEGKTLEADVPGLRALLTVAALDNGLPLSGEVIVRFCGAATPKSAS